MTKKLSTFRERLQYLMDKDEIKRIELEKKGGALQRSGRGVLER